MVPTRATTVSYWLAAAFTFGAVVLGSAVCATESGLACPTWPGCYPGQVTPNGLNSAIEFTHRVVAFGSLVGLGLAAWHGRRLADRRLRWFPVAALIAAIASGVFGMTIVLFGLPVLLGLLDVAAALVALCLISWAAVRLPDPRPTDRLGSLAWLATGGLIVTYLLGIVVAAPGSFVRCLGWPVWRLAEFDLYPGLQLVRGLLGAATGIVMILVLRQALVRADLRAHAVALLAAWVAEVVMGQAIVGQFTGAEARQIGLAAIYSMLAGTILWLLALLAAKAPGRRPVGLDADPVAGQVRA